MSFLSAVDAPSAPVPDSLISEVVTPEKGNFSLDGQPSTQRSALYFVDRAIDDVDSLIQGLERDRVVFIDDDEDGVAKITQTLAQYQDIESVHVFSHGMDGRVALGDAELSADTLASYRDDLMGWTHALTDTADILLYGCQVAASDVGTSFIAQMGALIGADVAASSDLTGVGGNWLLEVATGKIESGIALDATGQTNFSDTLALVNNGDFETDLTNWFGFTGKEFISSTESFTGSGSLELAATDSGVGQFVETQVGATYQLSGYAKTFSDTYSGFGLNFFDASYNLLDRLESGDINNSTDWQRYEMSGIAPVGTESVQVWTYHGGDDGSTFIDALVLSTVEDSESPVEDTTSPTAQIELADIVSFSDETSEFSVVYSDETALDSASIDSNDVRVTGPNGFSQLATLVTVEANADNSSVTATYRINAPGGSWDEADNGTYTVAVQANEVADTSGNMVAPMSVTFEVTLAALPDEPDPTHDPEPTNGTNLLENSGFESGLDNWVAFTGTESTATVGTFEGSTFEGNSALQLSASDSGTLQLVDGVAGESYQLVAYGQVADSDYLGFGILFLDENFNTLSGGTGLQVTSSDWQRYEMQAIAPDQTRYVQVWSYKSGTEGDALLDEFELTSADSHTPSDEEAPDTNTDDGSGGSDGGNDGAGDSNGETLAVSIQENNTLVMTVPMVGNNPTYSISGGSDASVFEIDAQTGALSFQAAPDYENPTDSDSNNRYTVEVTSTGEDGLTNAQVIDIDVTNEVSVYLLGGQSNMVGLAPNSDLPPELADPYPSVQIWQVDSQNFSDLRPGFSNSSGNGSRFGPELAFGRGIDGFADEEVFLVKHAQGSTNLAEDWDPDGANNTQYDTFVDRVSDALGYLDSQDIGYDVEGMLWMQGEFDAFVPEFADAYEANLTAFIADMRSRYGEEMKFAIGRLRDPFAVTLKAAQDAVAAADPRNLIVNTDDFELLPDGVHYSAAGQLDLGNGFAEVLKVS